MAVPTRLGWRRLVVPWAVSRVVAIVAVTLAGPGRPSTDLLWSYDWNWYTIIARHGYGPSPVSGVQTPWPFFPLYPALVRVADVVFPWPHLLMVVADSGLFLLAMVGVARLAERHFGGRVAVVSVWVVALWPMSVVFSMGYPSSLFLAASAWTFVLADERRWWPAAGAGVLATAVRPNGAVVALALAVALFVRGRRREAAILLAPTVAFLAAWCALCWYWTGDPVVFLSSKAAWHEVTLRGLLAQRYPEAMPHALAGAVGVAVVASQWRRLPLAWTLFALAYLVPSFVLGIIGLGRYTNECFPVAVAVALILARRPVAVRAAALAVSGLGLVIFCVGLGRFSYLP